MITLSKAIPVMGRHTTAPVPHSFTHDGTMFTRTVSFLAQCPDCLDSLMWDGTTYQCDTVGCEHDGLGERDVLVEWNEIATRDALGFLIIWQFANHG